jgi:hypothetical protein
MAGSLALVNGSTFNQASGFVYLSGGTVTVSGAPIGINGGSLAGIGAVTGHVTIAGICSPGLSPGQLSIAGDYTQAPSGILAIEIGGSAVAQQDHLIVSEPGQLGVATLDGTLSVSVINGYSPPPNSVYTFLICDARNGTFDSLRISGAPAGLQFAVEYGTQSVNLRVIPPAAVYTGNGNWSAAGNWSTGQVPNATTNVQILGNVTITQPGAVAQQVMILNGGSLTMAQGGTLSTPTVTVQTGGQLGGQGQITGTITSSGTVSPGSPLGTLTITGSYTQSAVGSLFMQLGGIAPGQYDALAVSGTATLAGIETVSLTNGFIPTVNQTFNVVTAGNRIGQFATVAVPLLPNGVLRTLYPANGVQHKVFKVGDVNLNGIVNVDDLLAVITAWGACPNPPATCPSDVAPPPNGNGLVNVDDLLAVIVNWG